MLQASCPHLDLSRAPYVLYGMSCIDLVSLVRLSGAAAGSYSLIDLDRTRIRFVWC